MWPLLSFVMCNCSRTNCLRLLSWR